MSETTPLHTAAELGDVAQVQAWLQAGKPVDPADSAGNTPLMLAIRQAEGEAFRTLLDAGADPHAANARGETPLYLAAGAGLVSMVRALLEKRADVNRPTTASLTPLIAATMGDHAEIVRLLLQAGADPKAKDRDGHTVVQWARKLEQKAVQAVLKDPAAPPRTRPLDELIQAACTGDVERLKELLTNQSLDVTDADGYTPLMHAAQAGKRHACAYLLSLGASPCAEASNGYNALLCASTNVPALRAFAAAGVNLNHQNQSRGVTPLMFAANQGFADVAEFLLQAGVDPLLVDKNGMTALERARRAGHRAIVKLLKEKTPAQSGKPGQAAAPRPKDEAKENGRQLLRAARDGALERIRELLAKGAPLEARNRDGYTPLMVAVENGREEAFDLLLQAGADPLARAPSTGTDALYLACADGHIDMVKALLAKGAPVNPPQDGTGYTPLMAATLSGKLELVQLLVDAGADVHARTFSNETALTWAREQKHRAIVAYLKEKMGLPEKAAPPPTPAPVQPADPSNPMQVLRAAVQNFAVTAAEPPFQAVLQLMEQLAGKPPRPSAKRPGVYMVAIPFGKLSVLADRYGLPQPTADDREPCERVLEKLQDEVRQQGFLLMAESLWEAGQTIRLRLFPTTDPYAVMASCGTNGNNYGYSTRKVIAWFQKLAETHPFVLTGCGHDFVAGRFTGPLGDTRALAKRMLAFCPDLADGRATPAQLARELNANPSFFFWWD